MEQHKYTAEQVVQCILNEDESDLGSNIDDQENDDSLIIDSEDDFVADFLEELHQLSNLQFVSRNGEVWRKAPTMRNIHRACAHNIVRDQNGPSRYALNTW